MADPLAVDRIDALSYRQRTVSQSAGGYALERQGARFFVVREADRNEVELPKKQVERAMTLLAYGGNLSDLLRGLWIGERYNREEFDP